MIRPCEFPQQQQILDGTTRLSLSLYGTLLVEHFRAAWTHIRRATPQTTHSFYGVVKLSLVAFITFQPSPLPTINHGPCTVLCVQCYYHNTRHYLRSLSHMCSTLLFVHSQHICEYLWEEKQASDTRPSCTATTIIISVCNV